MQVLLIFTLLIAILAVVFAVQNVVTVPLQFLVWKYESPLAVLLMLSVLLGVLISTLFSLPALTRSKLEIRNQRKKLAELESGLNESKSQLVNAQLKVTELEKALSDTKNPPVVNVAEAPNTAKME